jgi:hypothetical protein
VPKSALNWYCSPSPCCVMPYCASNSAPWKFFLRIRLTTPEMASAPYTAAAPPEMTSTLWMAAEGIVLRSTVRLPLTGCTRRPLTSTRLRFVPRLRRLTVAAPGEAVGEGKGVEEPLFDCAPAEAANCGSCCSAASMPMLERSSKVFASTVTMGLCDW